MLAALARDAAGAWREVIALELHVDYWNQLGWTDPFSSAAFTARQQRYADAFGKSGVYTPQAVIDGAAELVGSREQAARERIAAAAEAPKAAVALARRGDQLDVAVSDVPDGEEADVLLAVTEEGLSTAVTRGENRGSTLAHGPVVRSLSKIGAVAGGAPAGAFSWTGRVPVDGAWSAARLRAVVLVQRERTMQIVGAGTVPLG